MVVNLQFSENNVISFIKYTILVFVGKLNFLARVIVNISQVDQHLLLRDVSSCKHTQVTWKFWKYTHKKICSITSAEHKLCTENTGNYWEFGLVCNL
jgi:hypothetical protein